MADRSAIEDHKDRFAGVVGDVAWRAVRMPAEEREGYVWLTLERARNLYGAKLGALPPELEAELADELQRWTLETVRLLLAGRDDELWHALRRS